MFTDEKQQREANIAAITERLEEAFAENEEWLALLGDAIYQYEKKTVRKMILKDHKRPDGRQITEIRPLAAEIDILPRVHGSGMFTRGQTQILNACTLAPLSEAQKLDGLDENETSKRYMHHYNFPLLLRRRDQAQQRTGSPGNRPRRSGGAGSGPGASPARRSSPMPSAPCLRLWSPTVPLLRQASAPPLCP